MDTLNHIKRHNVGITIKIHVENKTVVKLVLPEARYQISKHASSISLQLSALEFFQVSGFFFKHNPTNQFRCFKVVGHVVTLLWRLC